MSDYEQAHIFEACGTLEYMSPERVEKRGPAFIISLKADIWSLGCILYKIKTADTPFKSVDQIIDSHVKFGPEFSTEDKNFISVFRAFLFSFKDILKKEVLKKGFQLASNHPRIVF